MDFKQLRERTNLSIEEGALKLGVKPETVTKYELAIRHPSQLVLFKMTEVYKCTHEDVMIAYKENIERAVEKYGKANP